MPVEAPTALLSQLKATKRLPSPPGIALRVLELCRRDDAEVQEIADTIMSDPALSGRLLKYANSALVGVGVPVTSVRDAVLLLGLRTLKMTALGFSLAVPGSRSPCPEFDLPRFWAESFLAAVTARRLAAELFNCDREEAFTAGLLSQIGRLALAHSLPEDYRVVLEKVCDGVPLLEAERQVLGIDYACFGAQLLADWGLPDVLVQAVARQQTDTENQAPLEPPLVEVAHVALRVIPVLACKGELPPEVHDLTRTLIGQRLKLDEDSWQRIADAIRNDYQEMAQLFDLQLAAEVNVFDLYAEAQEEVARVGMVVQLERARALEENKTLLQRATTDALTGVANRAKFNDRIGELVKGVRRGHGHFALIMLDIDHFKKFNDTYGHDVGDLVLKQVAETIHGALREVDLLARYGGEEFVILAPCTDRRGACVVAARACKSVEQMCVRAKGCELRVTISVGLAISSDYDDIPAPEILIRDADKQLYLSKHAGRNTWSYLSRTAAALSTARN